MLISGGNLIKKVLFPAEILPIVSVLANMVHFFLGLLILAGFLIYYQRPRRSASWLWFPVVVLVQLVLTLGFALLLSALTVHFRDIRDILSNLLTFWFFATPIIYPWFCSRTANPLAGLAGDASEAEPVHAPGDLAIRRSCSSTGPFGPLAAGCWCSASVSVAWFLFGYLVFDRLRDSFAEEV